MELKNILEDQMTASLWLFRLVLSPILILLALMLDFSFFYIFLTSIALMLPTILFKCSKQKPVMLEKLAKEKAVIESANGNAATQEKEIQEASMNNEAPNKYLVAESACLDDLPTSEDSEVLGCQFGDNVDRSLDFSDGSISDEESLIEISLSGGCYVDRDKEEESVFSLQQKVSGLSHKAIFQQHTLFEFLAEINEEENMIEIDISMGSIMYSRFEIHA